MKARQAMWWLFAALAGIFTSPALYAMNAPAKTVPSLGACAIDDCALILKKQFGVLSSMCSTKYCPSGGTSMCVVHTTVLPNGHFLDSCDCGNETQCALVAEIDGANVVSTSCEITECFVNTPCIVQITHPAAFATQWKCVCQS